MREPVTGFDPAIARVAGLPTAAMEPFSTTLCALEMREISAAEEELGRARADLVERLYEEIHGAPDELRRFLIAVKRDCFNGRDLGRHRKNPAWDELVHRSQGLADHLLGVEECRAQARSRFGAAFRRERARQGRHLVALSREPGMLRGLSLASPSLAGSLDRLRAKAPEAYGRKEKNLEHSLLRYLSRAALKLSPYSTLTRMALVAMVPGPEDAGIELHGGGWSERPLFRLKRFVLDQILGPLLRGPLLREPLEVKLNNTAEEIEPGRFRYLRPGYWFLHQESGELRYFQDALVKINLHGEVIDWLRRELSAGGRIYRDLTAGLDRAFPGGDARRQLDKLLGIDFLTLLAPWASHEEHLEKAALAHLRSLRLEALEPFLDKLGRLVSLEEGYASAAAPLDSLAEIDLLLDEIWREASALAGLGPGASREKMKKGNYYEDVFLQPAGGGGDGALIRISRAAAECAERSVAPIVRLTGLYSHRHDFLHALAGLVEQRWPGRREAGLLDVFSAAQPLWQEYRAFLKETVRTPGGWIATFDPLNLPPLQELRRLREELWAEVGPCVHRREDQTWIDPDALAAVAARVPEPYAPQAGPCLFIQPADPAGRLWVLNRLYEGTGRYGSRFTPVMDEGMRQRYADHFAARARFEHGGEEVELLDLLRVQGDTLNVHAAQTPRGLETPGERSNLPPSRTLSLRDLRVRVDEASGLARLVDAEGRACLAVHLGGAGHTFMPTVIKFLTLFGPGDFKAVYPARLGREEGPMSVWERLVIGNVVLARKKWAIPPEAIPGIGEEASDEDFFLAINRWRLPAGIPDRVFVTEMIQHKVLGTMYKPQYVDFTSPLFVPVLRAGLAEKPLRLAVEEVLPAPEMLPRDGDGTPWAVELQIDTLALRPPKARTPRIALASERAPEPSFAVGGG